MARKQLFCLAPKQTHKTDKPSRIPLAEIDKLYLQNYSKTSIVEGNDAITKPSVS